MTLALSAHRLHPIRWLGLVLISINLSGCNEGLRQRIGIGSKTSPDNTPVVSDPLKSAPLQPGTNVIVIAVEQVGPAVVRIDTVKRIANPLGNLFGGGPPIQRQAGQGSECSEAGYRRGGWAPPRGRRGRPSRRRAARPARHRSAPAAATLAAATTCSQQTHGVTRVRRRERHSTRGV